MKPFFILIGVFIISLAVIYFIPSSDFLLAGNIALATMLLFTSVGHFAFTKGMTMMLPEIIPLKKFWVYATGIFEVIAAIGLLIAKYRVVTGWILIVFFVVMLPANIYAAVKRVDHEKGNHEGKGTSYLWIRIPLQVLFISWVYYFAIANESN
jgi:uncharacterized membrane protein